MTTVVYGSKGWTSKTLAGATAVVLAGDDPAALASTMADPAFRDAVTTAVSTTPVVLADGAMTAVLGSRWSAKANAPEADVDAIEAEGAVESRGPPGPLRATARAAAAAEQGQGARGRPSARARRRRRCHRPGAARTRGPSGSARAAGRRSRRRSPGPRSRSPGPPRAAASTAARGGEEPAREPPRRSAPGTGSRSRPRARSGSAGRRSTPWSAIRRSATGSRT